MKKLCTLLAIMTFIAIQSFGQSKLFKNISTTIEGSGNIYNENKDQISGYYFLYKTDKVNNVDNKYQLSILNQNLEEVTTKEIIASKYSFLVDVLFNGKHLLVIFYDTKAKKFVSSFFSNDGSLIRTIERLAQKTEHYQNKEMYLMSKNGYMGIVSQIYSLENNGFIDYQVIKKTMTYKLAFFSDDEKNDWVYETKEIDKTQQFAKLLYADANVIYLQKQDYTGSILKRTVKTYIQALDSKTGKEKWQHEIKNDDYTILINSHFMNNETSELTLVGYFTNKDVSFTNFEVKGLYFVTFDSNGKVKNEQLPSWVTLKESLPDNQKEFGEKINNMAFYDFFVGENNNIFAIAEAFSVTQYAVSPHVEFENLYVLEFDNTLNLKQINEIEKQKLPAMGNLTVLGSQGNALALMANSLGFGDYSYTQKNKGEDIYHVFFYEPQKERKKFIINSATYFEGEISKDKIVIDDNGHVSIRVRAAKAGFVLVQIYDEKEKTLELRLEKINY